MSILYKINLFFDCLAAYFLHKKHLHTARFARLHELFRMSIDKLHISKKITGLFLAIGHFNQILSVFPTKTQKELANVLIIGKTRIGKGLNIETNLLTWPYPALVNDIKGELWLRTAGFREKGLGGKALKFDPRGYGHKYDPLEGRVTDFDLRSAATTLLHRSREGENAIFTERATTMLTQIFHAARLEEERPFPFTYKILNEGLYGVATILEIVSQKHNFYPNLATKFLDISYNKADFNNKFLRDCYSTMTTRINNILTKESVRCFDGSDFTAKDIITSGEQPISVYFCWPERDLLTLSPLIELVWNSLFDNMIDYFDEVQGNGCYRVTAFLDEIFRTGLAKLPKYATTVCGRDISLFVSAQSKSQFDAEYGKFRADELRGQFDTAIVHRPAPLDYDTMFFIQQILGDQSGYAHSQNEHAGATSTGESEQRIPLLPAYESELIGETQVIVKRSGIRPTIAERLDWRGIPALVQRANLNTPTVSPLPDLPSLFLPSVNSLLEPSQRAPQTAIFNARQTVAPV